MRQRYISTYISAIAISSFLLLNGISAYGQQKKNIVKEAPDTTAFFKGIAVSIDLVGPIQMAVSDYGQYEAGLHINLKDKYYPVFELGYGKADANDESTRINYKTSAPYARIGVDWNLLKNKHDIYRLYGGFRYGFTSYKFDMKGPNVHDPIWGGETPYEATDVSCYYHWLEGVIGVDAQIWGPVRMGWSLRYKRRLFRNDGDIGNTWYVPGFGKQGSSRFGGTFNITFEL